MGSLAQTGADQTAHNNVRARKKGRKNKSGRDFIPMWACPKKIDTGQAGFNLAFQKASRNLVTGFVAVQFAFGRDAVLRDEFA